MEKIHVDYRSKAEMLSDEMQLRIRLGEMARLIEELVGRLHFVHAKAESIQVARFIPFSKSSILAAKSVQEILAATTINSSTQPAASDQKPPCGLPS